MSMSAAVVPKRYALGMPSGSVRSILALLVVALTSSTMLVLGPPEPIPPYLMYLSFLIVFHFFAPHHHPAGHPGPLYVTAALVRLLIVLGLGGTVGWLIYRDPEAMLARWQASMKLIEEEWDLPLWIMGGFFLGVVVRMIVGRDNPSYRVQDFQACLALTAVLGIGIASLIHLVINPSLVENKIHLPVWEAVLSGVVAFYFGARS